MEPSPIHISRRTGHETITQKYNILTSEMIRRLCNVDKEGTNQEEKIRVVEELTKEMKSSGCED